MFRVGWKWLAAVESDANDPERPAPIRPDVNVTAITNPVRSSNPRVRGGDYLAATWLKRTAGNNRRARWH